MLRHIAKIKKNISYGRLLLNFSPYHASQSVYDINNNIKQPDAKIANMNARNIVIRDACI